MGSSNDDDDAGTTGTTTTTSTTTTPTMNNKDTMLAFVIENAGDTHGKVVSMPKPTLNGSSGDTGDAGGATALIRVLRAGVCNTDLEILQGYMGFTGVLGHEFVGIVESVSSSNNNNNGNDSDTDTDNDHDKALRDTWIGKRVVGDINVACCDTATCRVCRDAANNVVNSCCPNMARNHCPNRTVLGILNRPGCMAEYMTLPVRNLHVVPATVPDHVAVFCEPLAAACRIPEQGLISMPTGDKVAILGDGKLGLMIAEVVGRLYLDHCRDSGIDGNDSDGAGGASSQRPILFGKHPHKLDLVRDSGVETRLVSECMDQPSSNDNGNDTIVASQHAGAFDVVVDATGSPAGLALAASLCRPMGTLVLKSTCAAGEVFQAAPIVIHELRVVGSRCGPMDQALELLGMTGHTCDNTKTPLGVEKYITKTFTLAQAQEAIQCAAEKSTMKVQIICSER
jgi:threonine dehydrogenase-like Zn-dependent dehydrogenase